ncbi:MAG: AIR synthase family protein [Clostridia bacterium]|nr:AIR synthase family protein [Clostridia bacterium]
MRLGKLDNDKLNELILKKFRHIRKEVVCSPRIGVDCTAVDLGGRLAVLSTDPITAAENHLGKLTVNVSCNDAAAAGAEPIGLLVTLLVPPCATEDDIALVADELAEAAENANVEILGGHTEVTDSVTRMVTCATVLAKAGENGILDAKDMYPGCDLVLTKTAGLEGTAILASDFADMLGALPEEELAAARAFTAHLSVVKEGLYAAKHGAVAMHDVTEGGVLGAAWEMADAAGCGIVIEKDAIPVHSATRHICEILGLDPYRLLSSGAMLIACRDGDALVKGLCEIGIGAAKIGRAEGEKIVFSDGTPIEAPGADELYRLYPEGC